MFDYLDMLIQERAPATRGQTFLEAINFAQELLELTDKMVLSRRCRGAALELYSGKAVRKPRSPFTTTGVCVWETLTEAAERPYERIFAGFMCALIYWRSRFSDAARSAKEPFVDDSGGDDNALVEGETVSDKVKTGGSAKRLRRSVPLVGPAFGITGVPWAAN